MPNGELILGGNTSEGGGAEDESFVKGLDQSYFKGVYWSNNYNITDGVAVSESEFVVPVLNNWFMYKIVNGTFEKVGEYTYTSKELRCIQVEAANDGWVIGLWRIGKSLYLGAWNTKSEETLSVQITDELYDYMDDFDQVRLSVDVSKGLAVATYQETTDGSSMTKNVKNMIATFDLNKMVNANSIEVKWKKQLKTQQSYEIQDAVIDSDGNVYALLEFSSNKNHLVLGKYNPEGELITSTVWEYLNPKLLSLIHI